MSEKRHGPNPDELDLQDAARRGKKEQRKRGAVREFATALSETSISGQSHASGPDQLPPGIDDLKLHQIPINVSRAPEPAAQTVATAPPPPSVAPKPPAILLPTPGITPQPEVKNTAPQPTESSVNTIASEKHPTRNEDYIVKDQDNGTYAVFDGMGGHADGDKASRLAADVVEHRLKSLPQNATQAEAEAAVKEALEVANEIVFTRAQNNHSDMGTTGVVAKLIEGPTGETQVVIGSIGDSRAYIVRGDGALEQVTEDDDSISPANPNKETLRRTFSSISTQEELDRLTPDERDLFDSRNIIRQSIGRKSITPHIVTTSLKPGERLVLSSDGIHDNLTDSEIASIVAATPMDQDPSARLAQAAQQRSREGTIRSKPDDMTAMVILPKPSPGAPVTPGPTPVTSPPAPVGTTVPPKDPYEVFIGPPGDSISSPLVSGPTKPDGSAPPVSGPPTAAGLGGLSATESHTVSGSPVEATSDPALIGPRVTEPSITPPSPGTIATGPAAPGTTIAAPTSPTGPELDKVKLALKDFINGNFMTLQKEARLESKYTKGPWGRLKRFFAGEGNSEASKKYGKPLNAMLKVVLGGTAVAGSIASGGTLAPLFLTLGSSAMGQGIIQGIKEGVRNIFKGSGEDKLRTELAQLEKEQANVVSEISLITLKLFRDGTVNVRDNAGIPQSVKDEFNGQLDAGGNLIYSAANFLKLRQLLEQFASGAKTHVDKSQFTPAELKLGYRMVGDKKEMVPQTMDEVQTKLDKYERVWKLIEKTTGVAASLGATGALLSGHIGLDLDADGTKHAIGIFQRGLAYLSTGPGDVTGTAAGLHALGLGSTELASAILGGNGAELIEAMANYNKLKAEQSSKSEIAFDKFGYKALFDNIKDRGGAPTPPATPPIAPSPAAPPSEIAPAPGSTTPEDAPTGPETATTPEAETGPEIISTSKEALARLDKKFGLELNGYIEFHKIKEGFNHVVPDVRYKFYGLTDENNIKLHSPDGRVIILDTILFLKLTSGKDQDVEIFIPEAATARAAAPTKPAAEASPETAKTTESLEGKEIEVLLNETDRDGRPSGKYKGRKVFISGKETTGFESVDTTSPTKVRVKSDKDGKPLFVEIV